MSAINAKASRKMKKYAVLTREPRCFLGSLAFSWEQREVGDLLIERSQQAPMSDEYPLMAFIANEGVAPKGERYDRSALVTDTVNKLYKKTEKGDFIYSSNNLETGSIGLNKYGKACISPVYSIFEPTGIADSDFLGRRLVRKDFINAMVKWRQGVIYGQWRIHESDFLKIEITVPSVEEQRKIGAYLDQLDNLITLHQRECISFTARAGRRILTANKKRNTSSWEQRKLGDIGETYTGLSGKTKADFGHGQARFVTYMNVFSNPISNPEMTEPIEIDPKQNEVEVGDVFFTTSSETPEEVGMSSVLLEKRGKTYLNSFCFGFRPSEKIDSYYLAYMLRSESARDKIILLAQGISRYNISKNKVMEIAVSLPSLDEQKLIGQYFRQLDNLITLHQRKCVFLFGFFQAFISMIFTASTFSWEQRKLSEMCGTFEYGLNAAAKEFDGKNKYIRITDIDDASREFLLSDLSSPDICLDGMSKYLLSSGDIVFARTGASVGKTYIYRENDGIVYFAGFLIRAKVNQDNDAEFVFQSTLSPSYEKYIRITSQRSGQPGVNAQEYGEYDLFAPSKEEQQRIGQFLRGIDNLITLHQRQTIVYAVIRSIRKVILAERQYFAPPMVRKSP